MTSGLLLAGLSPGHSILILINWHWYMFCRLKLITMTLSTRLPGDCWLLQSLDLKSQLVRHRLWYVSIHLNLSLSVLSCHALYNAPNQFASRMAFQLSIQLMQRCWRISSVHSPHPSDLGYGYAIFVSCQTWFCLWQSALDSSSNSSKD